MHCRSVLCFSEFYRANPKLRTPKLRFWVVRVTPHLWIFCRLYLLIFPCHHNPPGSPDRPRPVFIGVMMETDERAIQGPPVANRCCVTNRGPWTAYVNISILKLINKGILIIKGLWSLKCIFKSRYGLPRSLGLFLIYS